jgi:small subunit ribosomal protein S17
MAKLITGTVVSTKMNNTVVVLVERKLRHPTYQKVIIRHKKFKAHCEDKNVKIGDMVTIAETKPISKTKFFIVMTEAQAKAAQEHKKTVDVKKEVKVQPKKEETKAEEVVKKEVEAKAEVAPKKAVKKAPAKKAAAKKAVKK